MAQKQVIEIEEAAALLGMSVHELKVTRQRGLAPGALGRIFEGKLVFDRDLIAPGRNAPRAQEPSHVGGGWYELSDGSRIQGKEAAAKAQSELEG